MKRDVMRATRSSAVVRRGKRVGVGKEVALEVPRLWIELPDGVGLRRGGDELFLRAEAALLEHRRHLADGQTLAEGDRAQKYVAAHDFVDDGARRHRRVETILPRLQAASGTLQPHRQPESGGVRHDTGFAERAPHGVRVAPGHDLDKRLVVCVALVRPLDQEVGPPASGDGA